MNNVDDKRPAVLYVIDTLAVGGAEKSLMEICSGLAAFRPIVVTLASKTGDLRPDFQKRGIEVIEMKVSGRYWFLHGTRQLKTIISKISPRIVHAMLFKAEVITRLALRGRNILNIGSFVNDSYSNNRYSQQSFIRNRKLDFIKLIDRFTAKEVDHFVSISNAVAESNAHALSVPKEKISIIYRGRDAKNFSDNFPPENSTFVFIAVARLLKRKGYIELFDACSKLKDKGLKYRLDVVGEGADGDYLRGHVDKLGLGTNVTFLGSRNDVPKLLAASHCFIFASHYEGQGGALVEAMLSGRPIIVSDIPVFQEQVSDGVSAKYFHVFDANSLAHQMEWVMTNTEIAKQLGRTARQVALERFSVTRMVQEHERMYHELVKEHS
jgi:glycosyltransferase involved in cell wall biosynthesis